MAEGLTHKAFSRDIAEIKQTLREMSATLSSIAPVLASGQVRLERLEKEQEKFAARVWTAIVVLFGALASFFFGLFRKP